MILATLGVIGTHAHAQPDWLDKIAGQYVGHLVEGSSEQPVVTVLRKADSRSNNAALSGEYVYRAERIHGRLEACSAVQPRLLRCTWLDQFGTGVLELEFDETLTSFNGRWSASSLPGVWFPWNGRITPRT